MAKKIPQILDTNRIIYKHGEFSDEFDIVFSNNSNWFSIVMPSEKFVICKSFVCYVHILFVYVLTQYGCTQ